MSGSIFERLGSPDGGGTSVGTMRDALRRDLEALLNARHRLLTPPPEFEALEGSLLAYGLDDFSHEAQSSEEFRAEFVTHVEDLLRRFEPRLSRVEVTVLSDPDDLDRTLRFRIAGLVTIAQHRQELQFDSHVDPIQSHVSVRA